MTGRLLESAASHATVLLTGFEPFGGDALNPSWMAAQALHGRVIEGHRVLAAQLPTVFGASLDRLGELLDRHRPALAICTGQAGGRSAISLERVAINLNDARIADNAGAQPVDTPVLAGAPTAYFSTLPLKAMRRTLMDAGLPVEVSHTAGTFVCNHVFFGLMDALATRNGLQGTRGGFIHLPWLPAQGSPSLPLADQVRGLRIAIATALRTQADLSETAGALD